MFKFLRKHHRFVFITLGVIILALPFFGIGGMSFMPSGDSVAKVNGQKVSKRKYDQMFQNLIRQKEDLTEDQRKQMEIQALQELVREEVMFQEAKKFGIMVPDQEIQLQILNTPAFQKDGQFDYRSYDQTVKQVFRMTPEEFEEMRRRETAAHKLNQLILSAIHVNNEEVQQGLQNRVAIEEDAKKRQQLKDNPDIFREELRQRKMSLVFQDWLAQINRNLRVELLSETLKARLSGK